jgi:hypothetical protein
MATVMGVRSARVRSDRALDHKLARCPGMKPAEKSQYFGLKRDVGD